MDPLLLHVGREAIAVALLVSASPLGAALLVGLMTGVLQAATQVQDATLGVVPRIAAALAALFVAAPWIAARVVRFAGECLELVARVAP